jgi:hypothetical protein
MKIILDDETVSTPKKNKPSLLWYLYHAWAAICFITYFKVSGLLDFSIGLPTGSDPDSASDFAAKSSLIQVSLFAIGYFLSTYILKVVDKVFTVEIERKIFKILLPILYVIASIILAIATKSVFSTEDKLSTPERKERQSRSFNQDTTIAFTTIQSADGLTDEDLNQDTLSILENWVLETMQKKIKEQRINNGDNSDEYISDIKSSSVYNLVDGKKLAIIKINHNNLMRMATIMGIKGNELVRISCMRSDNRDIPIWSGNCGEEISESLGLTISTPDS